MNDLIFTKLDDDIIVCENAFTSEQLDVITQICNRTLTETPTIDTATGDGITRKVVTSSFPANAETAFIYRQMANVSRKVNEQYFQFDLTGFIENGLFFLSYNVPNDRLDWHTDKVNYNGVRSDLAKLALVLQLTDPSEYEGCDVEAMIDGVVSVPKRRGLIYCMPGWVSHRVTPLISGTRNMVVAWATGPNFK